MTANTCILVGDIGGTHARFALAKQAGGGLECIQVLRCADYSGPEAAIADFMGRANGPEVLAACFAVAAPVAGDTVSMTNNHWVFDRPSIQRRFGWQQFLLVNDYIAMALGVLQVPEATLIRLGGGAPDKRRPKLILGPGTGLGVSALVPSHQGWLPLATEGGHVDFAPGDETEASILGRLRAQFGRVSVERLLCGPGLVNLYRELAVVRGRPATLSLAEDISAAALAGVDTLAVETLQRFCTILGRVAGNAVLTLGAYGGVYLSGGMVPAMLPFFLGSGFREEFENKGRMTPLLAQTPVWVVTDPCTGLYGAASALELPEA
ncbi:glucokinase [Marinobacter sp. SS5-14b]|uniref:glucokinase n=1 Tax=Marinobacter sp. SS5-14b TaxID=3050456 RepID=UPI0026E0F54F|nr:glucokinase [Marinobacter sp. SS5-14b]